MPPILNTKFFRALEKLMNFILIATGVIIVLLVTYYVVTRYVLKINFKGFEEICILVVVWMYFIGAGKASSEQSHISADMLELFVKNQRVVQIIVTIRRLIGFVVVAVMAYLAYDFMMFSALRGVATSLRSIPMVCYHLSLFLGMCLMTIYDLCYLLHDIKCLRHPELLEKKEDETA